MVSLEIGSETGGEDNNNRVDVEFIQKQTEPTGIEGGLKIESVDDAPFIRRVATHTHVTGLGLNTDGTAQPVGGGLVGQLGAREAAGLVLELIKLRKFAGKCVLLGGPMGSGKSAIAIAISKELGAETPFVPLMGSEIFSAEVKKTEILIQHIRRAIGVRITETKFIYEGEVTQLELEEGENRHGGTGKVVTGVVLHLRSAQGVRIIGIPPYFNESLQRQKIRVGDVIWLEVQSGILRRLGRSDAYATEADLEADDYVPLPRGPVGARRAIVQDVSLHELDLANARPHSATDLVSVFENFIRPRKTEITEKLRSEVNVAVNNYVKSGVAQINPGVLFIDEVHMLDIEALTFLNKTLESPYCPVIIMASNRGVSTVRGTQSLEPHGLPVDLLDRLLIIKTVNYTLDDVISIIMIRAEMERITLTQAATKALARIAAATSLRFAVQLMEPARLLAEVSKATEVDADHVNDAKILFIDARTSALNLSAALNPSTVTPAMA